MATAFHRLPVPSFLLFCSQQCAAMSWQCPDSHVFLDSPLPLRLTFNRCCGPGPVSWPCTCVWARLAVRTLALHPAPSHSASPRRLAWARPAPGVQRSPCPYGGCLTCFSKLTAARGGCGALAREHWGKTASEQRSSRLRAAFGPVCCGL